MDTAEILCPAIVVGIDGSEAAIRAAEWAVDEAVERDIPLRLVHAIPSQIEPAPFSAVGNVDMEVEYAETALRLACAAVTATGKTVKVDTEVVRGDPAPILIAESVDAAMICIGSTGIGRLARALLGSTATDVAENAHCPVAIVRSHEGHATRLSPLIVAAIDESDDSDAVVEMAIKEARLRTAPVLAVEVLRGETSRMPNSDWEHRVQCWNESHPDVDVYCAATRDGIADFLGVTNRTIALAVIGSSDADQVANLIGPHDHSMIGHAECSVLIVRP
ncbi:universal stress protein [Mycobacterium paraterrae]|uniref:Universal stress protein n=1 Tax=Mycobacterium paraterrae TaxID=577492 RepID=A0ABY3VR17_9MYCO|nr:universal stress protein [Mycobacterium paraterrae]UMB70883.1 universal stress protein [Mycobacterium paraterrae]